MIQFWMHYRKKYNLKRILDVLVDSIIPIGLFPEPVEQLGPNIIDSVYLIRGRSQQFTSY
jgi:hypothetical protein